MSPLTIFFIRHAEKPGEQWPGPGFSDEWAPNKKSLVIRRRRGHRSKADN
jgi:hypothetical protein